jgi:hypothetical protein
MNNDRRNGREGTIPDGKRHDLAEELIVYRRRGIAAQMRRGGATWQQIADTATYPDGTRCYRDGTARAQVYMDVKRGLEEATREMSFEVTELRELESQRLDDYLLRLRPGVIAGDPKAISQAIRITEVRARLYGLNEPERHEVITVDALDAAARELEQEIARRAALDARQGEPSA